MNDQICEPVTVLADGQSLDGFVGNALGILDVDLYKINVETILKDFVFTVNATGNLSLDPHLRLFDGNGNPLASDGVGFFDENARISHSFTSFGTHYLGVSTSDNEDYSVVTGELDSGGSGSTTGAYTITFEDSTDQISETVLFLSSTTTEASGFVDFPTDVTLYRISGEEGSSVQFDVSGSDGLDPFVRVFDSSGDPLAGGSNDNGGPGTDARVTVTFDDTDDFYVGVSSFQNTNYDANDGTGDSPTATNTGAYEITATEVSLDPNDRIANAFNLGNLFVDGTRTSSGNIDNVADVDLFRFEVGRAGSFVEIDIDRPVTGVDSFLRIFDAAGNPLPGAFNDDANAPGESGAFALDSFLGLELAAGVYYAGVSAVDNRTYNANTGLDDTDGNSTGSYTIEIQDRLHVDTTDDTNTGTLADNDDINTLREAIAFANDTSGAQTITFQPSVFASGEAITLSVSGTNQLEITGSVVIDGPGAADLAISGNDNSRVFLIDDGDDSTEIDVTIRGLVIRDGNTSANLFGAGESPGAGISNSEDLTLEDVVVRSNRSDPAGGATGLSGGGLFHRLGDLVVTRSTFSDNSALNGGGIAVVSGTAEIANSTFEGNTVRLDGGGVQVIGSSAVTIRNSTVVNNRAMDGSEVGFGGGLDGVNGMLTIHNTLVVGNLRGTSIDDTDGMASASSHNLIGSSGPGGLTDGVNGNIVVGTIPLATIVDEDFDVSGLLANVSVYSLVSNSPGIGAGSNAQAIDADGNPLTTDQDGGARIILGTVDIGAIESPFEAPSLIVNTALGGSNNTDGLTTLREAIDFANRKPGVDTITFGAALNGETITVVNELTISSSLNIDGLGADQLTISGGTESFERHRIFRITDSNQLNRLVVEISGLTIRDGGSETTNISGAGIANNENLTLRNISLVSNDAGRSFGGGLASLDGRLNLIDSTISGNSAGTNGGGIYVGLGIAFIDNTTVSGNSAGTFGGGLDAAAPTTIRNSTFTGNRADSDGDSNEIAGGIFTDPNFLTLHNTIVAGNFRGTGTTPSDLDSGVSLVASSSHNLIGSAIGGSSGLTDGVNGNIVGVNGSGTRDINTILDTTLANNGGPTQTHALVFGSPAIGAGDDGQIPAGVTTDQNGDARIQFGTVDIGAVESPFETPSLIVTIPADTVDDQDGETSLREAVFFANSTPAPDTIMFAAGLSGQTILLEDGQLPVTASLTIAGLGANNLTISGGTGASRVFNINDDTTSLIDVTISGVTIADGGDGTANVFGAGILNRENLTLDSVSIEDNQAGGGFGGGLFSEIGDLTIRDSTFSGNVAVAGGGLRVQSGTADIVNSTISGNAATVNVGGLDTLTPTVLRNVTVTGNRADSDGVGGGNIGGLFGTFGSLELHNTIVAGNFVGSGTTASDINGSSFVAGSSNNLIGSATGAGGLTDGVNGNLVGNAGSGTIPTSEILNTTLSNNGGPTSTHALLTSSPAIDMGNDALALDADDNLLLNDQRGSGFDRIVGVRADIGAFELQDFNPTPGDYNADLVVNVADYTVWRDTLNATGLTPFSGADGNGDGAITEADYDVWRGNYGTTFNPPTVSAMTAPPVIEETTDEAGDPVRTGFTDPVAREAAFAGLPTTQRLSYSVPNRSSGAASPTVAAPRVEDDALLLIAAATTAIESEPIEWEAIAGKKDQQPTAGTALESAFAASE